MIELKVINKVDPLRRNAQKQTEKEEFSPMNPPDAYTPLNKEEIPYEDMHPFLQQLMDEHKTFIQYLKELEQTLSDLQNDGFSKQMFTQLRNFFEFFDQNFVSHHQKEEKTIFPILHERLKTNGEHGNGPDVLTAINMMEDDHIKAMQLAAVVFNFFGVAMKLPDPDSRLIILDLAIEQSKVLIELLRLHIFREDHIVFALANKHITSDEFANLLQS